jgi:3-oxoacyl-[acyl-carrier-protein] synthase II
MIPNACAAGNFATAYAFDLIKTGKQDMLMVGGSDPLSLDAFTGFCRLGAVAPQICRPFDKDREGMMVAEGAGALVLESLEHAQKRGAKILAEIIGVGISSDAHHITAPRPDGEGLLRALQNAVTQANIKAEDIDYYCAHGTGTQANDNSESAVVTKFFNGQGNKIRVPVSSIKSALGHTMGAASAIANVACVMALQSGVLPPTTHFENADPEINIDVVAKVGRKTNPKIVVNSALAFGGNNAVVIWKKY